jgi:hypothetical protein
MPMRMSRRAFAHGTCAILGGAGYLLGRPPRADEEMEDVRQLKPGQFVWYPERAAAGAVVIIVSLPDQRAYVYRNGIRIGVSTCATGRPGHATPTGVFTILQKQTMHHSNLYNDAPMPFTERLTWSGVCLHAGNLPGYPDSHGCVHLPLAFAKLLYQVTEPGTPVIIADGSTAPADVLRPRLLWNQQIEQDVQAVEPAKTLTPAPANAAALGIVVSGADRDLFALRDGDDVLSTPVTILDPGVPLGTHVFVLVGQRDGQERWHSVTLGKEHGIESRAADAATAALDRVQIPTAASKTLQPLLGPGATLMITDLPTNADTRSGKDFVILTQAEA